MSNEISNTDDVIDSRDVIARISEIEGEAQGRYMEAHPEGVSWGELAGDYSGEWCGYGSCGWTGPLG